LDLKGKSGAGSGSVCNHRNIRPAEIVADEELRLSEYLGQRVDLPEIAMSECGTEMSRIRSLIQVPSTRGMMRK
jgi:hypothetical protein